LFSSVHVCLQKLRPWACEVVSAFSSQGAGVWDAVLEADEGLHTGLLVQASSQELQTEKQSAFSAGLLVASLTFSEFQ